MPRVSKSLLSVMAALLASTGLAAPLKSAEHTNAIGPMNPDE